VSVHMLSYLLGIPFPLWPTPILPFMAIEESRASRYSYTVQA
jgi:hypothetical protein